MSYRVGTGYDVHKLVTGRKLVLGGVVIEHHKGLLGYSDADVLIHSIADALLGAASLGDIGKYFPGDDIKNKDLPGLILLHDVNNIITKEGFKIENIDSTIIIQNPHISSFIQQMRENIAGVCNIDVENVSVKATTTDHLGYTGREEGIASQAIVLISN